MEGIREKVKKQLRFYFSKSNLACDKTLQTKLLYEKSVSVDFLLKFNKLRCLLEKVEDPKNAVAKACDEIPELRIQDDSIHLAEPLTQDFIDSYKQESSERTIYIENLPDTCSHDLLKHRLKLFGPILYISLPRFPESQILKGFCFIEFSTISSAESALAYLKALSPPGWEDSPSLSVLSKTQWLIYKSQLQNLKKRLRVDSPDREILIIVHNLPETLTQTQIENSLEFKPIKIEYKPGSTKAKLFYTSELDTKALIRLQPSIQGRQVYYTSPSR